MQSEENREPISGLRDQPLCTIAIPVYNREELVRGAIESALAHPQQNIEILVIDNCSTDNTYEVAKSYDDPRLSVYRNDRNLGLFGNFNRCLDLATGKYVCILCSDDRHMPGFLEAGVPIMEANPDVGILTSYLHMVDLEGCFLRNEAHHLQEGIYSGESAIRMFLMFQSHYAFNIFNYPSGCLFRKTVLDQTEPFPTDWKLVGDIELYLRLMERSNLAMLGRETAIVTFHEGQEWGQTLGDLKRVNEYFFLIDRYRAVLGEKDYRRAIRQTCATTMALGFKLWKRGHKEAARKHFEAAKSKGVGGFERWMAFGRLLWLRLAYKLFGRRELLEPPMRGLDDRATIVG